MIKGGSVVLLVIGTPIVFFSLRCHDSDMVTRSLFQDIDTTKSATPNFKIVNLDAILDDDSDLEKQFRTLPQEDKDILSDAADLINEVFSRSVFELIQDDETSCECLELLA